MSSQQRPAAAGGLLAWWEAHPPGTMLQLLFRVMAVACVFGLVLDASGLLPTEELPRESAKPSIPRPVQLSRPAQGDNLRPYEPDMLPGLSPEGFEAPRLPDGEPIEAPPFERMRFTFHRTAQDVPYILALGDIELGSADEFKRFDRAHGHEARYLFLLSRGGYLHEALELGDEVRRRELKTVVPAKGFCFSACPLVLAAGIERVVYPDAWVGLHQALLVAEIPPSPGVAYEHGQSSVAVIMSYLQEMSVNPLVWHLAIKVPPEEIYFMTEQDLRDTDLATIVSDNIRLR